MRFWISRTGQRGAGNKPVGTRWRRPGPRRLAVAVGVAVALAGTVAGVAAAGVTAGRAASGSSAAGHRTRTGLPGTGRSGTGLPGSRISGTGRSGTAGTTSRPTSAVARPKTLRTSCRHVAHIGDSTSVDLISPDYLPDPAQRLAARYADVGVRHLRVDASGGRSIVEEMPGQINGYKVASAWRSHGYRGCWVFALGTNDTANVAAGSSAGMMARIDQMMAVAHGQPVMWVNTRTLLPSGYWSSANEQAWDATLIKALAKYPNMRIFNWSAVAQPGWFLSDGIHYNSHGCAMRAKAIADALARAFPLNGRSASKIVR